MEAQIATKLRLEKELLERQLEQERAERWVRYEQIIESRIKTRHSNYQEFKRTKTEPSLFYCQSANAPPLDDQFNKKE